MASNPRYALPFGLTLFVLLFLATPTEAFGAGYVARGSHLKSTNFRHGDIALAIPLLATANRRLVKQIYFGNWLRDFSQLLDKGSLAVVPRPVLRALVSVFAFVQFGYATREFECTEERLGLYRPEEHVDNPRGYDNAASMSEGLRPDVSRSELEIDPKTGMKNYIANPSVSEKGTDTPTSAAYVEKELIAAIACGRQGNEEAYIHLGAALHTLEDFVAHSNYVELSLQRIGVEIEDQANVSTGLQRVFPFVGKAASVKMNGGVSTPIVTGTFGALDLLQTLLGEIEDKVNAMSLPGLEIRTSADPGPLQKLSKHLISLLGGLKPSFAQDVSKIQESASNNEPASWGELEKKPEKLWQSIEPVFKLRDDVVKWVYDHLTVKAVQDALATISTAIDKFVYMVLGIVLRPLLTEFKKVLQDQEQKILREDQAARLAAGEQSIFDTKSTATDPTHSQLAKDHYDHPLNSVAGQVATRLSSYTTTAIVELWQPGNSIDPHPAIKDILQAFHHPLNPAANSTVQKLMFDEVRLWVKESLALDAEGFEKDLRSLSASAVAERIDPHIAHSSLFHNPTRVDKTASEKEQQDKEQDFVDQGDFTQRITANIERQLSEGSLKKLDISVIKEQLAASPSGDSPNPLDSALSKIPGIAFLSTFEGISVSEIAAVEGMGETLKDALITMIMLDEKRGEHEEEVAASRFGWGKTQREKDERARLRELRGLLKIERSETRLDEGQFDEKEKKSFGESLKGGIEKLKIKAGGGGKSGTE